jgi:CheY-like chemotaxis protein
MTRVLVVDDDAALRDMLALILGGEGYEVTTAGDGADAMELLAGGMRPAVMLLDLMMPVMGGAAVCEWLAAAIPAAERPRVVILSAGLSATANYPGADATLAKPYDVDDVLALLRRFTASIPATPRVVPLVPVLPALA